MSSVSAVRELGPQRLQLMVVVARLYHVHGVRQREIGARLDMSQARVSRLLRQAEASGVVHTDVAVPDGIHAALEESIERAYGITEVHAVETSPKALVADLGRAAARCLAEATLAGEVVGFTSWSTTLQAMAFALPELPRTGTTHVVEMLGDLGSPSQQHTATRSTLAMAAVLGAEPVFLRTPAVVATPAQRDRSLEDGHVQRAMDLLDRLDVAFVGVGPPDFHSQLHSSHPYFSDQQLAEARAAGAVGQLNQRFLDRDGRAVPSSLEHLVIGIGLEQLRRAGRRVVVAGGPEKLAGIAAALRGGWIDVLVTDVATARALDL